MGDNYYGSGSELTDIPRLTIRCDSERLSVQLLSPHPETTEFGVPAEISVMIRFGNQQMTVETWERFLPLKTYDILTSKQPESFIKRLAMEDNSSLAAQGMGSDGFAWTSTFDISESKAVAQEVLAECNVDATAIN